MKNHFLFLFLVASFTYAQEKANIDQNEVTRIISELASDKMEGREVFKPGIDSASAFIEKEFLRIGLAYYNGLKGYKQEFKVDGERANNVIGVLPGKSKANEYVVFSAHFDHLGTKSKFGKNDTKGDKVFNGANDDASGVTAVIALANYFKQLNTNERTLVFVAFTGEEIGGLGSEFFTESINENQVIAMFNIEMIGTESKWGRNSAYITGFEKSDFGVILQRNLKGSDFSFYEDPYPTEQLFYRSDNARLAAVGVPANTISTSKMDNEPNYHKLSDEVATLDMDNMTEIIKAIALSSESIVKGIDTPTRIPKIRMR